MTNLRIGTILSDGCACRVDGQGSGVDLLLTPKEQTLQSEARSCLEANVPNRPLEHFDTESGFEQHRLWERRLFDGGWGVVGWPSEDGGNATSVESLLFEEEYARGGATNSRRSERACHARPDADSVRDR